MIKQGCEFINANGERREAYDYIHNISGKKIDIKARTKAGDEFRINSASPDPSVDYFVFNYELKNDMVICSPDGYINAGKAAEYAVARDPKINHILWYQ